jgi:acetyl-CoA acetyltransferase
VPRDLHRPLREAWIVEAVRTPIGRYGGALAQVRPDDLAAAAIRAVVDRSGIDPSLIEDVTDWMQQYCGRYLVAHWC